MSDSERKRLNSWKEIAGYLGRDLRTVARWEKEHGLPVHRIGGGKGRSVFAYTEEIDEWLTHSKPDQMEPDPVDLPEIALQNRLPLPLEFSNREPQRRRFAGFKLWAGIGLVALAAGAFAWSRHGRNFRIDHVRFSQGELIAYDAQENVLWKSVLDNNPSSQLAPPAPMVLDLGADGSPEVLVGFHGDSFRKDQPPPGGELAVLSEKGKLRWRLKTDEKLTMGDQEYEGPWISQGWTFTRTSPPVLALSLRHWTWWPSMVITADGEGKPTGKFVNSGWVYVLTALDRASHPFLLAGGISNSQDAGMLAVLDPHHLSGSSPEEPGSPYECRSCPPGKPLHYFIFPRTELNRITSSPYNRVDNIQILSDRIIVNTNETAGILESTEGAINAVYEFTPSMELRRADLHHQYWELHRRLEIQGKLNHSREQCPEKNGPPSIRSWTAEEGWKEVRVHRNGQL